MNPRVPPHSLEAEQGLIGCVLESAESVLTDSIALGIQPDSFHDLRCQSVWKALVAMQDRREPIDLLTVRTRLADLGQLDGIGGAPFLLECQNATPSASNASYFAGIIRDKAMLRKAILKGGELVMAAYSPSADPGPLLDRAEADLMAIRGGPEKGQSRSAREIVPSVIDQMERRMEGQTGIPTGFIDIDRALAGGLQASTMVVIAGRPSAGKTAWVMNAVQNIAGQWLADGSERTIGVFSLEMTAEDLTERMIAVESGVNTRRLEWLSPQEQNRLSLAAGTVANLPITIDDSPSLSVEAIRARARRLYRKQNARLFVVDYLQLVATPGSSKDRRVEVDAISVGLKSLAKELKCPVLVLAQLNRDFEKDRTRKPRLADLRECLTDSARLFNVETKKHVSIAEIRAGETVWSYDSKQRLAIPAMVDDVWPTGPKETFRLGFHFGQSIEATANHPFFTDSGWKSLADLKNGMMVLRTKDSTFKRLEWAPILSKEFSGFQETYDCRIAGTHCFFANGILTHNSGQVEQDADVVAFLYLRDPDKAESDGPDSPRDVFFRIGKQRNGRRDLDVPLSFLPTLTKFESVSRVEASNEKAPAG